MRIVQRRSLQLIQVLIAGNIAIELTKEMTMNWDVIEGNWKQFKGNVKEQWGKLTDDHLDAIAGKRDQLTGRLQEAYGITRDEAELQIKAFEKAHRDYQPKPSA